MKSYHFEDQIYEARSIHIEDQPVEDIVHYFWWCLFVFGLIIGFMEERKLIERGVCDFIDGRK